MVTPPTHHTTLASLLCSFTPNPHGLPCTSCSDKRDGVNRGRSCWISRLRFAVGCAPLWLGENVHHLLGCCLICEVESVTPLCKIVVKIIVELAKNPLAH